MAYGYDPLQPREGSVKVNLYGFKRNEHLAGTVEAFRALVFCFIPSQFRLDHPAAFVRDRMISITLLVK